MSQCHDLQDDQSAAPGQSHNRAECPSCAAEGLVAIQIVADQCHDVYDADETPPAGGQLVGHPRTGA